MAGRASPIAYLDHAAASPLRPEAGEALREALHRPGNPSSTHAAGRAARALVDEARERVARALGARPSELVFTSGATEAAALAVRGLLEASPAGRDGLVLTAVEHPCVRELAARLAETGRPVATVPVDGQGLPDLEALRGAVTERTALVCAMRANNETGVLLPVGEMAAIARDRGARLFCDAVQAVGKLDLDVRTLGADLLCGSGQKLGGPRGSGFLWVGEGLRLAPLLGGHQERGRRGGTENVPAVAGLGAAVEAAVAGLADEAGRMAALRDRLERSLLASLPGARVNGARAPRLPNLSSVTLPGVDAEALLMALDLEGICASAGSACSSGSSRPSHVLAAMGLGAAEARSTLRLSLGWSSTESEVDRLLERLPPLAERVRAAIPPGG